MPRGGLQGISHIPYERDDYWKQCCTYLGYECPTKSELYSVLGYRPLPTIEAMHRCRATHRVLTGGNRSGKTYGGMMEVMPYLFWIGTSGWVVSANYDLADELAQKVIDILIERVGMEKMNRPDNLQPWQFHYGSKNHVLMMGNSGSWLQLKSAESPDSMHARPLDWIVVDEASLLPFIQYDTRLVPRLADSGGWILSIGTFEWQTGEWFEEYFDIGQTENDMGIVSWSHPTEDNYHQHTAAGGETAQDLGELYHAPWSRIVRDNPETDFPLQVGQQVRVYNIDIEWLRDQKKRTRPEIYAARYAAQRATNPYLVFPDWSIQEYVRADIAEFDPDLPVYLAIDSGGTYAVAACQFKRLPTTGQDNELTRGYTLCIIDEIYCQTTVTTHEVFELASHRVWWPNVARWLYPHWDTMQGVIDVTAKEQKRAWEHLAREDRLLQKLHLSCRKVFQQAGIQTLQHFLDTHTIYVHPRCTYWNLEMRRWTYPPPSLAGLTTEDPRKSEPKDAWNHLTKAVIYLLVNKFGYFGKSNASATSSRKETRKKMKSQDNQVNRAVVSRFGRG